MTKNITIRRLVGILSILLIFAGFTAPTVFGDFYRWKDDSGNWHYSDQPPEEAQQDSWWDEQGDVIRTTRPSSENFPREDNESPDRQKRPDTDGMLWKIEASGVAPNYIVGTIHSEDPRVLDFSPALVRAFKGADVFIMEADIGMDDFFQMSSSMMFTDGRTLKSVLGEKLYGRTADALLEYGLPEMAVNQLKPWAAYTVLSVPKPKTGQFMDLVLLKRAKNQDKKVVGLETAGEQLAIFEEMPINDQVALLKDTLDHLPQIPQMLEQLVSTYAAGDLEKVAQLGQEFMRSGSVSGKSAAERLLKRANDDRNIKMVDRMLQIGRASCRERVCHRV